MINSYLVNGYIQILDTQPRLLVCIRGFFSVRAKKCGRYFEVERWECVSSNRVLLSVSDDPMTD